MWTASGVKPTADVFYGNPYLVCVHVEKSLIKLQSPESSTFPFAAQKLQEDQSVRENPCQETTVCLFLQYKLLTWV